MNVKELREALAGLPDDMIVIVQKDSEGNGYSPLSGVDGVNNAYRAETTWSGEVGLIRLTPDDVVAGYGEEDVLEGEPCCVLYPTN